jgi:hypothetical protein
MKTSPIGLLVCTLITGAIGYAQAAPANGLLAQSMRGARDDDEKRRAASTSIDDPGHGGNETDMEHRRRPHLGDDRRP